jgi:glycosyltransferase involved in cell wall biosynthesis
MCWHAPVELEFSIIMPCLNEARTLGTCIERARKLVSDHRLRAEIIVADNRSTDGSQEIARSLGARVVEVAARGYGRALAAGVAAAGGKYIIMGDADASYDFAEAGPIVDALRAGSDMVIGDRFAGGIRPGAMPWSHRVIGVPMLSLIGRLISGARVRDFHCGMRGFERIAVVRLGLSVGGMEYCTEMIMSPALAGLRVSEVPVTLYPDGRGGRPPHLRTIPDGFKNLLFMLSFIPRHIGLSAAPRA